ncbi:hypothetical protein RRG08_062351 [Elysia crispata]|uniref:Uncharacterized protein n=1 Tax=Elysia crispata TaxID=231223 RepID=A0AAE0YG76_9GAST|nr:hypothetical protein RRG08_062351 [Elysia crispata]
MYICQVLGRSGETGPEPIIIHSLYQRCPNGLSPPTCIVLLATQSTIQVNTTNPVCPVLRSTSYHLRDVTESRAARGLYKLYIDSPLISTKSAHIADYGSRRRKQRREEKSSISKLNVELVSGVWGIDCGHWSVVSGLKAWSERVALIGILFGDKNRDREKSVLDFSND